MDRSERFIKILNLLRHRSHVTGRMILEELEISDSTLDRDMDYMRTRFNTPIHYNKQKRAFCLDPSTTSGPIHEFPGLWLSVREVEAFLVLEKLLSSLGTDFFSDHLQTIRERGLPFIKESQEVLEAILKRVRIFRHAGRHWNTQNFEKIAQALVERCQLSLVYISRHKEELKKRTISPQRLVYYRANWYLDAWCHLRQELRSFSLDRVQELEVLNKTKAKDLPESHLDKNLSLGYGIFAGQQVKWAKLKFESYRARWIEGELWHAEQKAYEKDGFYYLEIPYADDRELILDILRYGPEVEVLEPEDLRQKVKDAYKKALAIYGN